MIIRWKNAAVSRGHSYAGQLAACQFVHPLLSVSVILGRKMTADVRGVVLADFLVEEDAHARRLTDFQWLGGNGNAYVARFLERYFERRATLPTISLSVENGVERILEIFNFVICKNNRYKYFLSNYYFFLLEKFLQIRYFYYTIRRRRSKNFKSLFDPLKWYLNLD